MQGGEGRVDVLGVVGGVRQRRALAPAVDGCTVVGAADELHQHQRPMPVHAQGGGDGSAERQVDLHQPGGLEAQVGPGTEPPPHATGRSGRRPGVLVHGRSVTLRRSQLLRGGPVHPALRSEVGVPPVEIR